MIVPQPNDVRFDRADAGTRSRRWADSEYYYNTQERDESPVFQRSDLASV
jgi:hypothetical protein